MGQGLLWDDTDAPPLTDKSLEDILKGMAEDDWSNIEHELIKVGDNKYHLKIWQMYDQLIDMPTLVLMELIKYFGTKKIKMAYDHHDIDSPGCETCDYGSRRGYSLEILNPTRGV